ncbi:hypothetical protein HPB48_005297 [Haemaphysalis longicornis]|uniref:Uncharacterized protein n=1 Tax=Haemaphysalis longicornis TaxID=44386 RepID=A0A9J6GI51_HAELO|nr:hypothetical protein HPB48_005297 [Haemaphysalis longicornis]
MESTSLHPQSVKHASTLRKLSAPVSMPHSDVAKNPHRNVTTHKRGHCSLQVTALTFCTGHTNGSKSRDHSKHRSRSLHRRPGT